MRRLGIYGPSGAGKDEVASYLVGAHGYRFGGSTSTQIARVVGPRLGMTPTAAYAARHTMRDLFRRTGDEMRASDPAALARMVLEHGNLVVGVRARVEARAIRAEGLVDEVWWIERPGLPDDTTLDFGPEECDLVLLNDGTLAELYRRIDATLTLGRAQ